MSTEPYIIKKNNNNNPMVLALEMIPDSSHRKSDGTSHPDFWDSVWLGGGRVGWSNMGERGGRERSQADEGIEGWRQVFPICPLSG